MVLGENMKRFLAFGVLSLFIISMMSVVLAVNDGTAEQLGANAAEGVKAVGSAFGGFFSVLFDKEFAGKDELLSLVFFAILLGMIVYSLVSSFFESNKLVLWIATGSITALSLIAIPSNFLEVIRVSYGAMGAGILTTIPFLIILMFSVKIQSLLIARLVWIFFAFYYLMMYGMKVIESETWFGTDGGFIYLIAFVLGLLIFYYIPFIRKLIFEGKIANTTEAGMKRVRERKARLSLEMERLKADETS